MPETRLSDRTRELMESVDEQFGQLQLNFNEFRELLETQRKPQDDGPRAA